jgi:hypothetical protein
MSPDGTRTMPAVIFADWAAQRPQDAAGWVPLVPMATAPDTRCDADLRDGSPS